MPEIGSILSQVSLFESLPEAELKRLAKTLKIVEIPAGEFLFIEGERGESFYVLVEGSIEIIKALGTESERLLAVRGAGEFVGEMSLVIPDGLRTASVRAVIPSRVLEMSRLEFDDLLTRHPKLSYEIVRVLSSRLNTAHLRTIYDLEEKNARLRKAYEELRAAQAQLIEKERLERELQLAYEIQMSILPQSLPQVAGFEFGALMVPARSVGGDFYDIYPLGNRKIGIVIGDVTDKGVPAAIFMAQTHALIRAEAGHDLSPGETLLQINRHLLGMNAKGLFVSTIFGVLDQENRQFTYARAGHELPLIFDQGGNVKAPPLQQGQPLGILADPAIDEQGFTIPERGGILLYTDGVTDASSPTGESFCFSRLVQTLQKAIGLKPKEICQQIFRELVDFQQGAPQFDDVTLVMVKSI